MNNRELCSHQISDSTLNRVTDRESNSSITVLALYLGFVCRDSEIRSITVDLNKSNRRQFSVL